jgi:hypothetical protein
MGDDSVGTSIQARMADMFCYCLPPAPGVTPFPLALGVRSPSSSGATMDEEDWKNNGDEVAGRPFGADNLEGLRVGSACESGVCARGLDGMGCEPLALLRGDDMAMISEVW